MQLKRIMSLAVCTIALTLGMYAGPAFASERVLRVALTVQGVDSFEEPRLENVSGEPTGYTVGAMSGTAFYGDTKISDTQLSISLVDNAFQISNTETGDVLYTSGKGVDYLAIKPNSSLTWFKGFQWRGNFVYKRVPGGKLTVINYVDLEDYVKGVLPYEIDPDWPTEALKAQAVCARAYAVCTQKHESEGYDLCNTTHCQVYYGGTNATPNSDAAVDATTGEVITYNGTTVEGNFFSSDGGATEDAANVWGDDVDYLIGKVDPHEEYAEEWTVTLTADDVQQLLTDAGYTIGKVGNVEVTSRTGLDNVYEVTVTDTDGNTVVLQRSLVRTVFGLKSIRYHITPAIGSLSLPNAHNINIHPSVHKVAVDNEVVTPRGYNINGSNYYKLRDIASIMNGTNSQFNVIWNKEESRIEIISNMPYQPVGGEMDDSPLAVSSCNPSSFSVELNGKLVALAGYNIGGNTYYRIRDIGSAIGFDVGFLNPYVTIQSAKSPDMVNNLTASSFTFKGQGWGHSVGMSQWGAHAMANQGYTYEEILKFYYTGIEISR